MTMNDFNKWAIELAEQEYHGNIKAVLHAFNIQRGC